MYEEKVVGSSLHVVEAGTIKGKHRLSEHNIPMEVFGVFIISHVYENYTSMLKFILNMHIFCKT